MTVTSPYAGHAQAPYPRATAPTWRRYPTILPVRGRRPPLWLFVVVMVVFIAPSVYVWWRYGPVGDVRIVPIHHLAWIEIGFATAVVAITVVFGWSRSVGLVPRARSAVAVPVIAVVLIATSVLLIATAGASLSWTPANYLILVVNFLAVGVFEEVTFRGLLWASLPRHWSVSRVLLVTSVCFGAVHLTNGFTTGEWGIACVQACVVSVAGLGLGALRLRTSWLALGVVTHAFIDAGLSAVTALQPALKAVDSHHAPLSLVLASLLFLALLGLYATIAVCGVVVLVRTFRAERQQRRWVAFEAAMSGADPWAALAPPTLRA